MAETPYSAELLALAREHFNEPIIAGHHEVVRLVGYGETAIDCYLICRKLGGASFWQTCVGGYVFLDRLRGQGEVISRAGERWDDLYRLGNTLSLNGAPPEPSFRLELRHNDWECAPPRTAARAAKE